MATTADDLVNVDRAFSNAWLVYINGIEVPTIGVNVSYGIWQLPEAQITLVPDTSLTRLGADDRVSVQVFYCDYWQNPSKPEFRLMFDGEIVAWSYVNVQRSRQMVLNCVDYAQIFTQLFFFFMSTLDDIATAASDTTIGVNINGVQTAGFAPLYPYSLFAQGLIGTPTADGTSGDAAATNAPLITRPIDYIFNVIIGLTGDNVPNRSIPASSFFGPWCRRTNLNRRFVAIPYLEDSNNPGVFPILRAVQSTAGISAVAQLTSDVGSAGSIWQVFETVLKTLMMEFVLLPTPAAYTSSLPDLNIKGPAAAKTTGTDALTLGNYFTKPNFYFGLPPACNVFFPSMIESFQYNETFITQPTRVYFNDETLLTFLNKDQTASEGLQSFIRNRTAVAHPEEVNALLRSQNDTAGSQTTNNKNLLLYPEEFFKGPVVSRHTMPRWFHFLAQAQMADIQVAEENNRQYAPSNADIAIYRTYAAYEFFKEKYSMRNGGLKLSFNPYPVPGFPCVVFDRRSTQVDVFGYVTAVTQTLNSRGCYTTLSFSHGRTIKEVFALLKRQFESEKIQSDDNRTASYESIFNSDSTNNRESADLVGAIAVSPAEVLTEVRDVIQNPLIAESFYQSLFFRKEAPPAPEEGVLLDVSNSSTEGEALQSTAASFYRENALQTAKDANGRKASFFYADHVNLEDAKGNTRGVKIVGLDGRTRDELLTTIIPGLRGTGSSSVSTAQRDLLAEATNTDASLIYDINPENGLTDDQTSLLNNLEFRIETAATTHNLDGDFDIVPKPASQILFNSYEAAMQFVARPICTLDEYINFLGTQGVRQGKIIANTVQGPNDPRTYPADYYLRIRQYRQGPPPTIAEADYGNTGIQSMPDGQASITLPSNDVEKTVNITVPSLPNTFPENITNWDAIILAYRINALERLAPRT